MMSKAFTNEQVEVADILPPLPVGRRPITVAGMAAGLRQAQEMARNELPPLQAAAKSDPTAAAKLRSHERQLRHLERRLSLSDVVPCGEPPFIRVGFGMRVTLRREEDDATLVYILVGPDEVDIASRRISHASPVGQALLGRRLDERVFLKRPSGIDGVVIERIEADVPTQSNER